jgi:hypothetical protein
MTTFLSATNAAKEVGVSRRHFWRLAESYGVEAQVFECGRRLKYFWLRRDIEQLKLNYSARRHG